MPTVCAENDYYPSYAEIEESLGKTETILLYFFSTLCLAANALMYAFSVHHLYKLESGRIQVRTLINITEVIRKYFVSLLDCVS